MTTFSIKNEFLSVRINKKGAELSEILNLKNQTNYLWNGDATYWGRHAPLLFPIVGKVLDNKVSIKGKLYEMGQHGFARDLEFESESKSETSITLSLSSSSVTKEKYPWDFKLSATYTLNNNRVDQVFTVENKDNETIYFSLGFHPAFPWPLDPKTKKEDWEIQFEKKENKNLLVFEEGYITEEERSFLSNSSSFGLSDDLFQNDVLIFQNLSSNKISLTSQKSDKKLIVHAQNYPFTGIWTKPGNPFVCIEPWHGIADSSKSKKTYENKIGIKSLQQGQSFSCSMAFEII